MAGGSQDDTEEQPSWLDTQNDEHHRQEVEPLLLGTGVMNLKDPDEDAEHNQQPDEEADEEAEDETDLETAVLSAASGNSKKTYGSTTSASSPKSKSPSSTAAAKKLSKAKNKLWPFYSSDSKKKKKANSNRRMQETEEDYDPDDQWPESRVSYNTKTGRPERPSRPCCLNIFFFVEACGILTCLCLLVSQTLPLVMVPLKEIEPVDMVLKVYISLFSLLFMIVEYDLNIPFVRQSVFLQTYASRGFLYSFLGLTCLEEAYSERVNDMLAHSNEKFHVAWFALFLQVSAWSLCALGVVYFIMGLFCMKRVRDKLVKDYRERWKEYREALKEWKKEHADEG
ncbi:COPI associated protein [Nitzschia inconspicua]|uniref:COPI associated protein n=1 Tax=Nitzschia inconspicua TaxID=303405 RepID=A0A9K3LMV6_9STRA|nr:COPI associated protein [Nitzschia inconspicua]